MGSFSLAKSQQGARFEPLVLDWALALERPETILARDYWRSRCVKGTIPSRADLLPAEMRKFITHVGLIETHPRGEATDYLIRHAGSQWEAVFGAMKGRRLPEFLTPEIEERWRTLFDAVREAGRPVRATTRIAFKGKSWLRTEMFIAPLSEGGGEPVSMLFMCFTSWSARES
jgi:hypothetical protein